MKKILLHIKLWFSENASVLLLALAKVGLVIDTKVIEISWNKYEKNLTHGYRGDLGNQKSAMQNFDVKAE